ncbi:asparagine synthase-related protein [Streptomyces sp. NPDC005551]
MRRIWRPLVMTSDKLASAYALERRSPYLARDLIEVSYRLPAEHKISDPAQGKRILRDAAKALGLPREVWARRGQARLRLPGPRLAQQHPRGLGRCPDQHRPRRRPGRFPPPRGG